MAAGAEDPGLVKIEKLEYPASDELHDRELERLGVGPFDSIKEHIGIRRGKVPLSGRPGGWLAAWGLHETISLRVPSKATCRAPLEPVSCPRPSPAAFQTPRRGAGISFHNRALR